MIIPGENRVVVKFLNRKDVERGGIIIPGKLVVEENLLFGQIENKGTTKYHNKDLVFYSQYSATTVRDGKGYPFHVVAEDDIMAVYQLDKDEKLEDIVEIKNDFKEVRTTSPIIKP